MRSIWFSACVVVATAAWLVVPAEAQKGKGGGKGGQRGTPGKSSGNFVPSGPGTSEPARPFAHPKSGNTLPQEVRDKLPPGLRDKPADHPGVANHLGKMGWTVGPDGKLTPPTDPIPPDVRRQLPPGLRDKPFDHPGVANHLGKMGWTIGEDGTLTPPPVQPPGPAPQFRPLGGFFRRW